jgi:hypothetical protein
MDLMKELEKSKTLDRKESKFKWIMLILCALGSVRFFNLIFLNIYKS